MIFYLYCLEFPNGKRYIGYTGNPIKRFKWHRQKADRVNRPICQAIKKYGLPPHRILCVGERDYITDLEIKAIEVYRASERRYGYNVTRGGAANPMDSQEVRAKHRVAMMGNSNGAHPCLPETRTKISAAKRGHSTASETRAKISATLTGRKGPPSPLKGQRLSPELCAKRKGRTPWNKGRVSLQKGIPLSPEHRAKISLGRHRQLGHCGGASIATIELHSATTNPAPKAL